MKEKPRIFYAPGDDALHGHAYRAACGEISKWLHEPRYKPQHSNLSYRVLNDWTEKKLVDDERDSDSQSWRKFSITDLLWIKILVALRGFGLGKDTLKQVKRSLKVGLKDAYPTIETAVLFCVNRYPVFIAVFEDGHAELATAKSLAFTDDVLGPQSYLRINVNTLFRELIGDSKGNYLPRRMMESLIETKEAQVLEALREQGINELTIHKQRDKISMIESTKYVDGTSRIIDHIKDIGYGDIQTRVEAGKQRHTKITKRRKLD